jgi:hypothetical protein
VRLARHRGRARSRVARSARAVPAQWAVARRYMGVESLQRARMRVIAGTDEEVPLAELADVS